MKPYHANFVNAIVLVIFGLWGYFGSDDPSFTALIPVVAGVILLLLSAGLRKENRTIAHITVIFTFLVLVALFKPLTGAIERSDSYAVIRVLIMIASSLMALVVFVKSFLDARSRRESR